MKNFGGQIGLLFVKAIGSLPFSMIFILSDFLYFILFRIGGYRKKVVIDNIRDSFTEKSESEVKKIANGYFRYLADLIMEGLKMHSISEAELKKRMKLENEEDADKFYDQGKSILIVVHIMQILNTALFVLHWNQNTG